MTSLFISYSRKNIDFAHKLTDAFNSQQLDFWIDWEGIPPTVDWWGEIEKGIEEADIFLFLISHDSIRSDVCKQEIEHAIKNGKRLIPIVVEQIKSENAPKELSHLNWIFLRENDDFGTGFDALMLAIKTDYEWVQAHRKMQVRALEWERSGQDKSFLLRGKELQRAEEQLAANTSKEPYPTDLQRQYIYKSRKAIDGQKNITLSVSLIGVIVIAALALYGFAQAGLVTESRSSVQTAQALADAFEAKINTTATALAIGAIKNTTATVLAMEAINDNQAQQTVAPNSLDNQNTDQSSVAINGYNTTKVKYDGGEFSQSGNNLWIETSFTYNNENYFQEIGRDEWSVYLYDESRGVSIQLDLYTREINYSDKEGSAFTLYEITDAQ